VFLDAEAAFNLNDLDTIVQNTGKASIQVSVVLMFYLDVVVIILTSGIFDSEWCLKEIRSAIKHNKQVCKYLASLTDIIDHIR
jgi:hypothetical protein